MCSALKMQGVVNVKAGLGVAKGNLGCFPEWCPGDPGNRQKSLCSRGAPGIEPQLPQRVPCACQVPGRRVALTDSCRAVVPCFGDSPTQGGCGISIAIFSHSERFWGFVAFELLLKFLPAAWGWIGFVSPKGSCPGSLVSRVVMVRAGH